MVKQKRFLLAGVMISLSLVIFGAYKMLDTTSATRKNPLINISELPEEFMEEYFADYAEMTASDSKENILIVSSAEPLASDFGAQKVVRAANNQYFLEYATEEEKAFAQEQLSRLPNLAVSENHKYELFDDEESGEYNSWGIEKMGLDHAAEMIEGAGNASEVVVAVLDTGLDTELFNKNFSDKLAGTYSVVSGEAAVPDSVGHGTHTAGTIAEGTPSNVKVFSVQLSTGRSMYTTDIVAGMDYATYYANADVVNMSFGGYVYGEAEYISIEAMREKKMIPVASAGNESTSRQSYPASFDNTISVSALDVNLNFASEFSNFGKTIDFAAPGVDILSINTTMSGTSMATPHVAAAAAIAKSLKKDFDVDSTRDFLATRAVDLGMRGKDSKFGYGFIDFNEARFCTVQSEVCDEFEIFEKEVENGIEIDEVALTPYNYGSLTNILATTMKIKNKSGSYKVRQLGDFGTDIEITGYDPYATGEQEVNVKYGDFEMTFTVENPNDWENGWTYKIGSWHVGPIHNEARLAHYKDNGMGIKTLYLPEEVDGETMVSSLSCVFGGVNADGWCNSDTESEDAKYFETVVLPATYTRASGFEGDFNGGGKFENLYRVVSLADELVVASGAFEYLPSLEEVDAKILIEKEYNSWSSVDGYRDPYWATGVFWGDKSLKKVVLSENNEKITNTMFFDCGSLEDLEIPDGVTEIEQQAFMRAGIRAIDLKNVQKLGEGAFMESGLEEVRIPASLTEIGKGAFGGANSLTTLTVAADNPVFDSRDESNAVIKTDENKLVVGIETTVIPASVKTIGEGAFEHVTTFDEMTIPEGVETIEAEAFKDCFYLQKVVMPRSLTSISDTAFFQAGTSMPSKAVFWIWSESMAYEWVLERGLPYVLMDEIEEGQEPKLIANAAFEVIPEGRRFYAFDTFTPENFIIKVFYYDAEADKVMEEPEIVTDYNVKYYEDAESLVGGYNYVTFVFGTATGYRNIKIDMALKVEYLTPEYEVPTGISAYSGQALLEVELPERFSWMDGEEFVEEARQEYLARFTPEDSVHYEVLEDIAIPVEVKAGTTFEEIFPDEALRACIVGHFDGEVELDEVLSMTELDCANLGEGEGIINARGIERMTALEVLNLAGNSLERINLSKNTALSELDLRGNGIRNLDVANNSELVELLVDESGLGDEEVLTLKTAAYLEMIYAEDGSSKVVMDISGLKFLEGVDWTLEDTGATYDAETGRLEWDMGGVRNLRVTVRLESGETIAYTIDGFARDVYVTTVLNGEIYDKNFLVGYTYTGNRLDLDGFANDILNFYGLSNYVLEDVVIANDEPREYVVGMSDMKVTMYFKTKKKKGEEPVEPDEPEPVEPSGEEEDSEEDDVKAPETGVLTVDAGETGRGNGDARFCIVLGLLVSFSTYCGKVLCKKSKKVAKKDLIFLPKVVILRTSRCHK